MQHGAFFSPWRSIFAGLAILIFQKNGSGDLSQPVEVVQGVEGAPKIEQFRSPAAKSRGGRRPTDRAVGAGDCQPHEGCKGNAAARQRVARPAAEYRRSSSEFCKNQTRQNARRPKAAGILCG
jgi:hypothetical protein